MSYDLATLRGTPAFTAASAKFGGGGLSSGLIGALNVDSFLASNGFNGTIECWFKSPAVTDTRVMIGHQGRFWIGVSASGQLSANYTMASGSTGLTSAGTGATDGAWHHAALVFTNGVGTLYLDGVQGTVGTQPAVAGAADKPFIIGGLSADSALGGYDFAGSVDEVRLSSVVRYTGTSFTVPTAPFADSVSGTAALYHLESSGADSFGASVLIAPDDANVVYSPYNWHVTSARALSINPGAYVRTLLAGSLTSVSLGFDVSNVATDLPQVAWRIDGGPWQSAEIAATITVPIPGTNTWGRHLIEWVIKSTSGTGSRWNSPWPNGVKFLGYTVPAGATTAPITRRKLHGLVFGDSITEGVRTLRIDAKTTNGDDATLGWALLLADTLGAEIGVVGFQSQGWISPGAGFVPTFADAWDELFNGTARPVATPQAPDFILINHATNDQTDPSATATSTLTAILATYPASTKVMLLRAFGGKWASQMQAVVTAIGNPRLSYIDTTGWWTTSDSADSSHPNGLANLTQLAPRVAAAVRSTLGKGAMTIKRADGSVKTISPVRS